MPASVRSLATGMKDLPRMALALTAGGSARREEARLGRLMIVPVVVVIAALVIYPLVRGLDMSLHSDLVGSGAARRFVGLRNYGQVAKAPDTTSAALHTVGYLLIALALELVGGLSIAVVLRRAFRGRGLVFAILILPWALPSVVSGVLWSRVFSPDNGLLNAALLKLGLIHSPEVWFAHTGWAIFFITLVHAWGIVPLISLIFLSGLQGIPDELYSVSAVDGAGPVRQFLHITLPLLRPSLAVALTTGTTLALAIFDEIYVLNGAALNTRSIMMQVYQTTFVQLDFGHGTALAFMLTAITALFGVAYVRGLRRAAQ